MFDEAPPRLEQIIDCVAQLEKTEQLSPDELKELQSKKLRALVKHSYENVPYYHWLFDQANLNPDDIKTVDDITKIPIVNKQVMIESFPLNTTVKNYSELKYCESSSSGTTGEQFLFLRDRYTRIWTKALLFRCWKWIGYTLGDPYSYLWVARSETEYDEEFVKSRKYLYNELFLMHRNMDGPNLTRWADFLMSYEIDNAILDSWVEQLKKHNPRIIYGFTSVIYLLAKFLEYRGITDIKPQAVLTAGITLFESQREYIKSQFECDLFDAYGGDGMVVSHECQEHAGYHIMSEGVICEFIKDGEPASPGERGAIVLTNLNNYMMPFIRYSIEDVGIPSDDVCPCGRGLPLMERIEGRIADIIRAPNGNHVFPHYFLKIFGNETSWMEEWQILQETESRLRIKVVKNNEYPPGRLESLSQVIRGDLGELDIEFEFVESIPPSTSGKKRFTISEVPPPFV